MLEDADLAQFLKDLALGQLSDCVKPTFYGKFFQELSLHNNLVLKGKHILIPPNLWKELYNCRINPMA